MARLLICLVLAFITLSAFAELQAPTRALAAVADPTMVVIDRGARLEVLPNKRAITQLDASGREVHRVSTASAAAAMSSSQLGVVFNHAMQQQGYISGEITFKVKGAGFSLLPAQYPGLKLIIQPSVYAVYARSPAQFIQVLKRLQARTDLEWVEPTVTYGRSDSRSAL
jgi:hypothetical protein